MDNAQPTVKWWQLGSIVGSNESIKHLHLFNASPWQVFSEEVKFQHRKCICLTQNADNFKIFAARKCQSNSFTFNYFKFIKYHLQSATNCYVRSLYVHKSYTTWYMTKASQSPHFAGQHLWQTVFGLWYNKQISYILHIISYWDRLDLLKPLLRFF